MHPNEFHLQKRTPIGYCTGSGHGERLPEIEQVAHAHLLALLAAGKFKPLVTRVVEFDAIPHALRDLADRRALGRIVAKIA